jgi:hypothetical protein
MDVLGPHFGGTVVCEGYKVYDAFHTARCNSHPMHRISEILEANIGVAEDLLTIRSLLSAGMQLSKNTGFTMHLHDRQISLTNNYFEQTLRKAVLLRKIGCCNGSEKGVGTFETLNSLFATFAKRGNDFKDWIKEWLIDPGPKCVPPILLPADFTTKILRNFWTVPAKNEHFAFTLDTICRSYQLNH